MNFSEILYFYILLHWKKLKKIDRKTKDTQIPDRKNLYLKIRTINC